MTVWETETLMGTSEQPQQIAHAVLAMSQLSVKGKVKSFSGVLIGVRFLTSRLLFSRIRFELTFQPLIRILCDLPVQLLTHQVTTGCMPRRAILVHRLSMAYSTPVLRPLPSVVTLLQYVSKLL